MIEILLFLINPIISTCPKIETHVEWRELTDAQQNKYLTAVKCLRDLPSILKKGNAVSHWDDFTHVHAAASAKIHSTVFIID